jgi:hypothetical protein
VRASDASMSRVPPGFGPSVFPYCLPIRAFFVR